MVGRYLHVVHTGVGFRVFDLDRILRVPGGADTIGYDAATGEYNAHGYAYVLPQVDTVAHVSECAPRFSFVALDRTTTPPSLLSGEYDATSIAGRLYRWPLDPGPGPGTGRLQVVGDRRVIADRAWFSGHSHVQGALSLDDQVWLSSSQPAARRACSTARRRAPRARASAGATPRRTSPLIRSSRRCGASARA